MGLPHIKKSVCIHESSADFVWYCASSHSASNVISWQTNI